MAELRDDIAVYESIRADLEAKALGKWVVVHDRVLVGTFDTSRPPLAKLFVDLGEGLI